MLVTAPRQTPLDVGSVPHLEFPWLTGLAAAAGQPLAVGAESHAPDHLGVPLDVEPLLPGGGAPDFPLTGVVALPAAVAGEPLAVGAKDRAGVPFQGEHLPTTLHIPDLDRPIMLIKAASGQPLAVRAESHAREPVQY